MKIAKIVLFAHVNYVSLLSLSLGHRPLHTVAIRS